MLSNWDSYFFLRIILNISLIFCFQHPFFLIWKEISKLICVCYIYLKFFVPNCNKIKIIMSRLTFDVWHSFLTCWAKVIIHVPHVNPWSFIITVLAAVFLTQGIDITAHNFIMSHNEGWSNSHNEQQVQQKGHWIVQAPDNAPMGLVAEILPLLFNVKHRQVGS